LQGHQAKIGKCSSKSGQFVRTRGRSNSTVQLVEEQAYYFGRASG
jgi:hypothetical protein